MRIKMVCIIVLSFLCFSSGQVCNTATILRPGRFSIGIAPVIYTRYNNDLDLYLNAGVGITRDMDLSIKLILDDYSTYFGGDFEFVILSGIPTISLAAGMHSSYNLGVDATFNLSLPIRKILSLYGGLDGDIEFYDHGTGFPLWGFLGLQVMVRRHLGLFMEIDVGIHDFAPDMLDIGINVFF
jgi:hypothetical protein